MKKKKQMTKEEREMVKEVCEILSPWDISTEEYQEAKNDPQKKAEWRKDIRVLSITHRMDKIYTTLEFIKIYLLLFMLLVSVGMLVIGTYIISK